MSKEHEEFMRVLHELQVSTAELNKSVAQLSEVASTICGGKSYGRRLHDELIEESGLTIADAD